jgi:two-component system phosphate regulon sensor histidine kinase PhoR
LSIAANDFVFRFTIHDSRFTIHLFWFFIGLIGGLAAGWLLAVSLPRQKSQNESLQIAADVQKKQIVSERLLLTSVTANLREGVVVVNENMLVTSANLAAQYIFSHVQPPLEGKRLTDLTRNLSVHNAFVAALDAAKFSEIKVETRGDAEKRIFDLRVAPLRFQSEAEIRAAIGVFYDITRLEQLERVRQEFLSNVSHELRTPLTAILAFVETLEDGAISDEANNLRFLGVIRKNAERMRRLINDILELSAIEAGKIIVKKTRVKLAPLVAEIVESLSAKAQANQVVIKNQVEPNVEVFADADRLAQMLTNLIDNAVKFNRPNGTITICAAAENNRFLISVADTGEGIAHEDTERIFQRFYRVDRARAAANETVGGTGLGLAIVKHLARLQGGEVSVVSTLGKGSTFTIELPK